MKSPIAMLMTSLLTTPLLGLGIVSPPKPDLTAPPSLMSLELEGATPVLTTADTERVQLSAVDEVGDGEDLYRGQLSGPGLDNEQVEVSVYSALPLPDLESIEPELAPRELAPGDGEVFEEAREVTPTAIESTDLQPVFAYAVAGQEVAIAAPKGSTIIDVKLDGMPIDLKTDEASPDSISFNAQESEVMNLTIEDVRSGNLRELELPLSTRANPTPTASATATVAPAGSTRLTTEFRYSTFIPARRVDVPWVCHPLNDSGTYNGNNRSFMPSGRVSDAHSNKSKVGIKFDWTGRKITNTKSVSRTYEYNSRGEVIGQATASASGIKFFGNYMTQSYGRSRVNHAVGNPLCWIAGDIWYTATVDAWRGGLLQVHTRRVKVPAHEYYARSGSIYWTSLSRQPASAFMCLNVNCGTQSTSITAKVR